MKGTTRVADLSTRQLRTVIAVARYESFLAAAADMRTSQSAISRVVKQVEDILGVALFYRTTRHVALTPAGRDFIPIAERVVEDLQIGVKNLQEMADAQRGRLYVASLMSLTYDLLPAAVAQFWKHSPNIEIQIYQRVQSHVIDEVRSGAVDIGIANLVETDERIDAIPVGAETFYAMLPAGHPLAGRKGIGLEDLASERLISVAPASNIRKLMDGVALSQGLSFDHAITLDQITMVGRFVRRGLGVALVPGTMRAAESDPQIAFLPLTKPKLKTRIAVYYLRERGLSPVAKRFIDAIAAEFAQERTD